MKHSPGGTIKTRLFVPLPLKPGSRVTLSREQLHKVRNVLRLESGERVGVFNGTDGEWNGCLEKDGRVRLDAPIRRQRNDPDLWLLFAPLKQTATRYLVEKATELGVSKLQPHLSERTVVKRINPTKLSRYAIEAAEQSERLTVPQIDPLRPLPLLLDGWTPNRDVFLCAENGTGSPILKTLFNRRPPAAILTGPEGGFSPSEFEYFSRFSFIIPVDLGARLLRAETAAHAAISCWQAVCGDWDSPSSIPYDV